MLWYGFQNLRCDFGVKNLRQVASYWLIWIRWCCPPKVTTLNYDNVILPRSPYPPWIIPAKVLWWHNIKGAISEEIRHHYEGIKINRGHNKVEENLRVGEALSGNLSSIVCSRSHAIAPQWCLVLAHNLKNQSNW